MYICMIHVYIQHVCIYLDGEGAAVESRQLLETNRPQPHQTPYPERERGRRRVVGGEME